MEYLIADLIGGLIWLFFYFRRKDLRREIIVMSLLAAPLGLFDLLYVPTYWTPQTFFNLPIGIEGIIFSFIIGGIAAASYAEISKKKIIKISKYHKHFSIIVLLSIIPTMFIFNHLFPINIAISMYVALLLGIALTVLIRKDLLRSTIIGALTFGLIYGSAIIFWSALYPHTQDWFNLVGLPKIFIFNAPVYEIIFGFLFGAYWGNLYEILFGYKYK